MPETTPPFAPVLRAPGEGLRNLAFGARVIRVRGSETAGRFALWEEPVPPGAGPPLHVHQREDEFFQVLAGRFRFRCGDMVAEGGEGTTAFLPRGVPHAFRNVGGMPARLQFILTPGEGGEAFFRDLAPLVADGPPDPLALTALADRYGTEFVGPPLGD